MLKFLLHEGFGFEEDHGMPVFLRFTFQNN